MPLLRRMAWAAVVSGVAAGLMLSALQAVWVTPLILTAESYEGAADSPQPGPPSAGPQAAEKGRIESSHSELGPSEPWHPSPGLERLGYTVLADVLAGVGFALLLAAGMTLRGAPPSAAGGVLWGAAGYASFTLAPALGLPPELPGVAAAELQGRQLWWIATVLATGAGLAVLAFAPRPLKALGAVLLLAPQVVGAPHPPLELPTLMPPQLAADFVAAVLVTSAAFWAALGALCSWGLARRP